MRFFFKLEKENTYFITYKSSFIFQIIIFANKTEILSKSSEEKNGGSSCVEPEPMFTI